MTDAPIWSKGTESTDERIMRFLAGDDVVLDRVIFECDIRASKAHVSGLGRIGVLSEEECISLRAALDTLLKQWQSGNFILDERYEDGHSAIEAHLTAQLGDVGRKVHTGRSRNDQVLVATRLYLKEALTQTRKLCVDIAQTFLDAAQADETTPMPGYTHLQRAVPSTVGLWLGAFAESFIDNAVHVGHVRELLDACPLGTAAGYGVNLELDRQGVADELGFARLQLNAMYAQNSRGKFELLALGALQTCLLDVRRFAWDLSLFTTEEFGFVRLPDQYTTGSSIMPNKRNPDVVELLRSACAVVVGAKAEIESILSLPSGYQRDVQGTKGPMVRGVTRTIESLSLIPGLVSSIELDRAAMRAAFTPAMFATDLAIELAANGVPFREAYQKVGRDLAALHELPIEESIAKRRSLGGAGCLGLDKLHQRLASLS